VRLIPEGEHVRKVVDVPLPTTMVGSYPRPSRFTHQLHGQDIHRAFKLEAHAEAFDDAVASAIRDQEDAGLDAASPRGSDRRSSRRCATTPTASS
jgi:methionine synthase II (cobalamin-independent)